MNVLHIEDRRENRLLVRKLLEARGHRVTDAADGLTGIELALAEQPDLILVDINIPGLDGYEVVTRRKPNERFETAVHVMGILFLLSVMVLVTYRDIFGPKASEQDAAASAPAETPAPTEASAPAEAPASPETGAPEAPASPQTSAPTEASPTDDSSAPAAEQGR